MASPISGGAQRPSRTGLPASRPRSREDDQLSLRVMNRKGTQRFSTHWVALAPHS